MEITIRVDDDIGRRLQGLAESRRDEIVGRGIRQALDELEGRAAERIRPDETTLLTATPIPAEYLVREDR